MENLVTFENNKFGKVRVLVREDGEIFFVAKDVASALGYSKLDAMYRRLRTQHMLNINPQKPENSGFPILGGNQIEPNPNVKRMKLINEGGLYKAIFGSELDSAIEFQDWVVDEVLPSIRKTGKYCVQDNSIQVPQTYAEALLEAGRLALDNEKKQKQLEEKQAVINHQEEKIDRLTVKNSKLQEENDRMQATCEMPKKHVVKDVKCFVKQFTKNVAYQATHRTEVYQAYLRTRWSRDVQPPISMFEDILYELGFRMSGDYWVNTVVLKNKIR